MGEKGEKRTHGALVMVSQSKCSLTFERDGNLNRAPLTIDAQAKRKWFSSPAISQQRTLDGFLFFFFSKERAQTDVTKNAIVLATERN